MLHGHSKNTLILSKIVDPSHRRFNLMPIKKKNTISINQSTTSVQGNSLLCAKMALHAVDIEQPVLLG